MVRKDNRKKERRERKKERGRIDGCKRRDKG